MDNVRSIFISTQNISDKDLFKLANLYFLEAVLQTKEPNTFINMDHIYQVENLDDFYLYPWGTIAFATTMKSIKNAVKNNETGDEPRYHNKVHQECCEEQ